MTRLRLFSLCTLAAGILGSCGTGGGGDGTGAAQASATLAPLSQRLNEQQGYVSDAEGNWKPRNNRRSQFENLSASGMDRRNSYATRRYDATEYKTAEWTRARSSAPKGYTGDTDGSRFRSTAGVQGQTHRESSARVNTPGAYQTSGYGTSISREDGARRHDRPADAQTENRRGTYVMPEIIDWRQQRELSIDQSRSILRP